MRRSHFTAVVRPTGRVVWLCERTAILVILMALIMMSVQWIAIVWACPGVACQADKILAATRDGGLDYLCLGLRICISRPFRLTVVST